MAGPLAEDGSRRAGRRASPSGAPRTGAWTALTVLPFLGAPADAGADPAAYRALVELSPSGQLLLDRWNRVRLANPAAVRLFGSELKGKPLLDVIHPAGRPLLEAALAAATGAPGAPVTVDGMAADGSAVPVEVVVVRTRLGNEPALAVSLRDVRVRTELQRAVADRTERADRMRKDLLEVQHVATRTVRGTARAAYEATRSLSKRLDAQTDGSFAQLVSTAEQCAARTDLLLDGLSVWIQASAAAGPMTPTSGEECLAGAVAALADELRGTGSTVNHGPLPRLEADPAQLTLLFRCLVSNAIRMRGGSPARVSVHGDERGDEAAFVVRSSGATAVEEHRDGVFSLADGLQLYASDPAVAIGFGVAKKVVERHGGRIGWEGTGGPGWSVAFALPKRAAPPAPAEPVPPARSRGFDLGVMMAKRLRELV